VDARSVYTPSRWPKIPSQTRKEKGGQKFYSLEIFSPVDKGKLSGGSYFAQHQTKTSQSKTRGKTIN